MPDLRTGVAFREIYDALYAEVRVMERSAGWHPHESSDPVDCYDNLSTLGRDAPHGGGFTYRSADTNMLGWVCERAAGTRMADLFSTQLWQPLRAEGPAEVTCDAIGSAIHDGHLYRPL